MSRVRIHVLNPKLAGAAPFLLRNPQTAISIAEGAQVYADLVGSPSSKRSRLSLLFCFSGDAESKRSELIREFLDETLHFKNGRPSAAETEIIGLPPEPRSSQAASGQAA